MLLSVLTCVKRSFSVNIYFYICTDNLWMNIQEMSNNVFLGSEPNTRSISWRDAYSSLHVLLNCLLKKILYIFYTFTFKRQTHEFKCAYMCTQRERGREKETMVLESVC